jgi:hypothetical protein
VLCPAEEKNSTENQQPREKSTPVTLVEEAKSGQNEGRKKRAELKFKRKDNNKTTTAF